MRVGICAGVVGTALLVSGAAWAACPSGKPRDCVVNLGLVPAISQQIVAGEQVAAPAQKTRPPEPTPAYSGPMIGAAPNLGRAPEIGYRWAID